MKTDPRVKSQTQRSADEAISEMLRHNRGLKPKWTPKAPHVKIKKKKTKLKIKASFDIETLQFFGSIFLFVVVIFVVLFATFCLLCCFGRFDVFPPLFFLFSFCFALNV